MEVAHIETPLGCVRVGMLSVLSLDIEKQLRTDTPSVDACTTRCREDVHNVQRSERTRNVARSSSLQNDVICCNTLGTCETFVNVVHSVRLHDVEVSGIFFVWEKDKTRKNSEPVKT